MIFLQSVLLVSSVVDLDSGFSICSDPRYRFQLRHKIFFHIASISSQFRVGLIAHNSFDEVTCCARSRSMELVLETAVATLKTAESHQLRVLVRVHVIGDKNKGVLVF